MRIVFFIASLPEDELHRHQFPLGPGYVGAWLQREFPDLDVRITATPDEVIALRPDLVAISSVTQCYNQARQVAARVRCELDVPVILGGYHISALPQRLDLEFAAGVLGEGELPMTELVRCFRETGAFPAARLAVVPGICWREGSGRDDVRINPQPPRIPPDDLPRPLRNISRGARNIVMFSSRGCAYRCEFCASTRHWGRLRNHSARFFVDELKDLVRDYDATSIYLLDDLFFADRNRVFAIADLLAAEGLRDRFTFHGFTTSNLAEDGLFDAARRMGFRSIRFGGETGSDRLLKRMKGSWASVASHQRCIDLGLAHGLEVSAAFMLGTPGETVEDLDLTVEFLERNRGRFRINGLYLTTPIPGTPYWDLALAKGLVSLDMDFDRLNIDFGKTMSFDIDRCIYLNAENVPLETVGRYYALIRDRFAMVDHGTPPAPVATAVAAGETACV
ncbi:MAG: B12-binding domain-containing radical SAM protein [bacterium]|nr:B12-binding domain-containing radical SAM protein [bacterium]